MTTAINTAVEKGDAAIGAHLARDVSLPALVLHREALEHNIRWMQTFVSDSGAELAPHGKTSMTPALFKRQLDAGAWGITLASATQTRAAYAHGVRRVLMANQLVGTPNMALIADLLADPSFDFYCMVDHPDNVADLGAYFASRGVKLNVMIEYGVVGGRCGCRSEQEVIELAKAISAQPALALTGIEGYEGVIHGDHAVSGIREFAASLVRLAVQLQNSGAFAIAKPIITASGSAWYDLIAESFEAQNAAGDSQRVASSSYVAHDHGIYKEAHVACSIVAVICTKACVRRWKCGRTCNAAGAGFAVIALGKRDVAYDAGLPVPLLRYRAGVVPAVGEDVGACKVTAVRISMRSDGAPGVELRVGDIILWYSHQA